MARDVFARKEQTVAGAMSADEATFTMIGGGALITQNITLSYQQPVNRIYSIGSNGVYLVAGRARGDGGIQSVVGPGLLSVLFLRIYGNVCNAAGNTAEFSFGSNCYWESSAPGSGQITGFGYANPTGLNNGVTLNGIVITGLNDSVRAEDMVISENINFLFLSMKRGIVPVT